MKRIAVLAVLAGAMVLGSVATAHAATASGVVVIQAQVNSKVILTVPGDHDFGPFDPDAANPLPYVGNVNVRSNAAYTLGRVLSANNFPAGVLSVNTPAGMDGTTSNIKQPSAVGLNWPQTWTLDLRPGGDWVDPGNYTATFTYTATTL